MPVGEYMLSSLKSNKSIMLDKSKRFKKTLGGYGYVDKDQFDFPETNPDVLLKIRDRLQRQRRLTFLKQVALFLIISILTIVIVTY